MSIWSIRRAAADRAQRAVERAEDRAERAIERAEDRAAFSALLLGADERHKKALRQASRHFNQPREIVIITRDDP